MRFIGIRCEYHIYSPRDTLSICKHMSKGPTTDPKAMRSGDRRNAELDISDEDILDAMAQIPGYLDISTADFREIYHLAHAHALERLFGNVRAGSLMRSDIEPVYPDTSLEEAARVMACQVLKGIPVVDDEGCVVGMLTETDFLRRLQVDTFLELLLRLLADTGTFSHRCHETPVSEAMNVRTKTVLEDAGFQEIFRAFHAHEGRSMPVVDRDGRLRGLLLRKDCIKAFHLDDLL